MAGVMTTSGIQYRSRAIIKNVSWSPMWTQTNMGTGKLKVATILLTTLPTRCWCVYTNIFASNVCSIWLRCGKGPWLKLWLQIYSPHNNKLNLISKARKSVCIKIVTIFNGLIYTQITITAHRYIHKCTHTSYNFTSSWTLWHRHRS